MTATTNFDNEKKNILADPAFYCSNYINYNGLILSVMFVLILDHWQSLPETSHQKFCSIMFFFVFFFFLTTKNVGNDQRVVLGQNSKFFWQILHLNGTRIKLTVVGIYHTKYFLLVDRK